MGERDHLLVARRLLPGDRIRFGQYNALTLATTLCHRYHDKSPQVRTFAMSMARRADRAMDYLTIPLRLPMLSHSSTSQSSSCYLLECPGS